MGGDPGHRPSPALACKPLFWQEARWNTGPRMKRLPFNPRQPILQLEGGVGSEKESMANGSHSRQPRLDNCTSWGQHWSFSGFWKGSSRMAGSSQILWRCPAALGKTTTDLLFLCWRTLAKNSYWK